MSVCNERPTIILSGQDDVHFIATLRTILLFRQRSGRGMQGQAQHGAMSDGVNLRTVSGFAGEWIVFRNGPVVVEAEDFADIVHGILGPLLVPMVGGTHEKRSIG